MFVLRMTLCKCLSAPSTGTVTGLAAVLS